MSHDTHEAPTFVAYQVVHDVGPIFNAREATRVAGRSPNAHPGVAGKAVHALTLADADAIASVDSAVTEPQR
ncbi:hypothetical protein [Xanthomonas arboricola]|uniref:hypothetical protein n=1 Tax=Xanthomonas arboricola TaxID=56448 RepID=UPI00143155E1|nr:hypothetical protein [Xanthomonas arboricola]NJB94413.1 hypothetical protein [Xanthomonas arboricola]